MTLTNEDLFAISQLLDVKLEAGLKSIENDTREMKGDIISFKHDMRFVKTEINSLNADMRYVKGEIISMKEDIVSLKDEIHRLKLCNENIVLPRLNTIESCYTSTYNRYKDYADRMDAAFVDIDLLKKVAEMHSEQIQKLA